MNATPSPAIEPVRADRFTQDHFASTVSPTDLLYFLLNVGDGDAQVLVLPEVGGRRQVVVVDVANGSKVSALLDSLVAASILDDVQPEFISLLVATHPHGDHIAGAANLLRRYRGRVAEVWTPGFLWPSVPYWRLIQEVGQQSIRYSEPSAGSVRLLDAASITVLNPTMEIKNRYYTYGLDPNNASICLRIDTPPQSARYDKASGTWKPNPSSHTLLLGADALTLAWGSVMSTFPALTTTNTKVSALRAGDLGLGFGSAPLKADIFKVPHHGSKHGVNLELVESISPTMSLFSCADPSPKRFPHAIAQACVREGMNPTTLRGGKHGPDCDAQIFYTGGGDSAGQPLGTIAVQVTWRPHRTVVWRFRDSQSAKVDLADAIRFA
jgi:beta-lactamase superfamily II metal-dependent hydrolase